MSAPRVRPRNSSRSESRPSSDALAAALLLFTGVLLVPIAAQAQTTAPPAPTGLSATGGNAEVELSWMSGGNGGSAITKHQYQQKAGTGSFGSWTDIPNSAEGETNATSYTMTGLTNGTEYTFKVRAVNDEGDGAESGEASATPAWTPTGTTLTATAGNAQVTLSWTLTSDGGSAITKWEYAMGEGRFGSIGAWSDVPLSAAGETNADGYTVTGLTNGTTYRFVVRPVNDIGNGSQSAIKSATPAATVPPAPTLRAMAGDGEVALSWTSGGDGGSAITKWQYNYRDTSGANNPWEGWADVPMSAAGETNATSYTVTGLTNGTAYTFTARLVNDVGTGANSTLRHVTPMGTVTVPTGAMLTATASDGEVALAWTVTSDGGSAITKWQYIWRTYPDGSFSAATDVPSSAAGETNANGYTVRGLTNGQEYEFAVRPVNTAGNGSLSEITRATPERPPLGAVIWSATLTADSRPGGFGCAFGDCSSKLTDDDFTVGGTTYSFETFVISSHANPALTISFDKNLTGGATKLTLVVDGKRFPFRFGTQGVSDLTTANKKIREWTNSGLNVSSGQTVSLRLEQEGPERERLPGPSNVRFELSNVYSPPDKKNEYSARVKLLWDTPIIPSGHLKGYFVQERYYNPASGGSVTEWTNEANANHVGENTWYWVRSSLAGGIELDPGTRVFTPGRKYEYRVKAVYKSDASFAGGASNWSEVIRVDVPPGCRYNGATCTSTGSGGEPQEEGPGVRMTDTRGTEDRGFVRFFVNLYRKPNATATVDYQTHDGTARAGQDYVATSGTLTFEPDDPVLERTLGRGKYVTVPLIDDTVNDSGETFTLVLSNPMGVWLDKGTAQARILNHETNVSVADAEAREGEDAALEFVVTLDPADSEPLTVAYATADGTATAGEDYTAQSGTLTFEAGETTKTVSVPIADDGVDDGGETVMLSVASADGLNIVDGEAVGTIRDAGAGPEGSELSVADAEASAEDAALEFVVTLDPAADATVTVDYATSDGTATEGEDYTAASGTLTFEAGETTQTISVPIADDDDAVDDDGQTVTLTLSNAEGAEIADAEATGTIRNTETQEPETDSLTAEFVDVPSEHDGQSAFSFRVAFSEDVGVTLAVFRDESLAVTGGEATQAKRVDGRRDLYEVTVQPDSRDDVTVTLAAGAACGATGAVCTRGSENQRALSNSPSATVAGPPDEPLTATFDGVPAEHTGETFTFGLTFSEDFPLSYKTLRDEALEATGGTVRTAKRQQSGSNRSWTVHVAPDGDGTVTVRLPAGSVETDDGRALSNSLSATVAGPVGISVADARVEEDAGAVLAFTVALSRAASSTLTMDYATSDGSAQAGVDYTAASGTLTFQSGESSKTIEVAVLDDAHDEGEETLTLTLSNPSSGRITDADATGTIENRDPLPRALLARFGRTAAVHVVEHVEERLQAPREPGFEGRFAGRQLRAGMEREMALDFLRQLGGAAGMHPAGMNAAPMDSHGPMAGASGGGMGGMSSLHAPGLGGGGLGMAAGAGPMGASTGLGMAAGSLGDPGLGTGAESPDGAMGHGAMGPMAGAAGTGGGVFGGGLLSMGLGDDLLTGSDFALNRESRGGILSFWSRGARSHFSGREGTLGLNGDVRTTMLGADYARGPLVAGLSLSHSRGLGEYAGVAAGQVLSSVTGLYPWLGYEVTERVTVWGVGGYGAGGMLLTPDGGPALESGLSMAMAAAGTRGELVAGGASGFELAFKADALWVGTAVDGVDGPTGRLKATDAAVTRFRTGLEGSRAYTFGGRLSLTPSVELGLRHDGGDAETGAGMDVGVGLILSDASTGLSVDVRVRTLLVHQDENFSERGVALSLSYNPTPSTPLGFMAKVAPSWGGQATSGAEALWGRETMAGMAQGGVAQGNRFDGEVGYGLPVGSRFVGTPRIGFSTSEYGRDYRVGYGLGVLDGESLNFELGVDAQRRESPLLGGADNGVLARASLGW